MEIKKMIIENKTYNPKTMEHDRTQTEVIFVNESCGTRNGFKHISNCFINEINVGNATVNYCNRTWEVYRYQSVMKKLIGNLIEKRTEYLKNNFKFRNNIKRWNKKYEGDFELFIAEDDRMNLYYKIHNKLGDY